MKIAISTDQDRVAGHFGRCPAFTIADIEKGKVINRVTIENPGHRPDFLPKYLNKKGVNIVVSGGMGGRAQELFTNQNIDIIFATGKIDHVLKDLANNTLQSLQNTCSPKTGKGYGLDKTECAHKEQPNNEDIQSHYVCITSECASIDSNMDSRFGRCNFFIFINPETLVFDIVKNPFNAQASGVGIRAAQLLIDREVKTLITGHVGPKAESPLVEANIKIINKDMITVQEAIHQYKASS